MFLVFAGSFRPVSALQETTSASRHLIANVMKASLAFTHQLVSSLQPLSWKLRILQGGFRGCLQRGLLPQLVFSLPQLDAPVARVDLFK